MENARGTVVQAGAELLDRFRPGWALEIDLGALDMQTTNRCVLGQLYGVYMDALRQLRIDPFDGSSYGFSRRIEDPGVPYWQELRDLWTAEIKHRTDRPTTKED